VTIAVHPTVNQQMYVASETGGLFASSDGGSHWKHLDGLPNFGVNGVGYAPLAPNIAVASAGAGYKVSDSGLIWRTSDGGATWQQPAGSLPAPSARCGVRPNGYTVAFAPGSSTVYVGTDCGLAVSPDAGVTWSYIVVDPSVPVNTNQTQDQVLDILPQSSGRINVIAASGLYLSTTGGSSWTKSPGFPGFQGSSHSLAASPYDPSHLLLAGGWFQLFFSIDGGLHWTDLHAPGPPWPNRPPFVKIAKAPSGAANQFVAYWGNGVDLFRLTFTDSPSGPVASGTWTQLHYDHTDPADLGFDLSTGQPLLLASDGGVHTTADGGATWVLTGAGSNGYNALQMTEVTGESINSPAHLDLYYGTQDNLVVASGDGGVTWPVNRCCEGFYLRTERTSANGSDSKVSGVTCSGCGNFLSDPVLANQTGWPDPPNNSGNPFLLVSPGNYIQNTVNHSVSPLVNTFMLTPDTGTHWNPSFVIPPALAGIPAISGPASNPTVYQAVQRPGTTPDGLPRIGLMKATGIYSATPAVDNADGRGFGSLGIFPTMFAWYIVYGVDPTNPDHLIIADIESDEMKVSHNGGHTWHVNHELTDLVTGSGAYRFRDSYFTLVHSIAFDPFDSCQVYVGTGENGIFRSLDGGHHWTAIRDTRQIGNLSSFYFPPAGPIFVSTYGRGLWQLDLGRKHRSCHESLPASSEETEAEAAATIVDPATGARTPFHEFANPENCPRCQFIVVLNGAINEIKLEAGEVKQIGISGGAIYQLNSSKQEVPLQIPNVYTAGAGQFGGNSALLALKKEKVPIRGLIVDGAVLKGVITSQTQLPFKPSRVPYARAFSQDMSGGITKTPPGGAVTIEGEGFASGLNGKNPLRVFLAGAVVADNIKVDADGRFRVQLEVKKMPGNYEIVIEQRDGNRLSQHKTFIKVVTTDKGEPEKQNRNSTAGIR
jgi:photosystem II stability/assembly factor-like uncharacterized protein